MADHEALETELIQAGRTLRTEPVSDVLVTEVLAAVGSARPAQRGGVPGWWRWLRSRRRRLVAAVIIAVLLMAALTPPVRAAVLEWLRIGGVLITTGAPATTPVLPSPGSFTAPTGAREVSLEAVKILVDFPVGVPTALGRPSRITVTEDRRVVGMDWVVDGAPVHLDQFDGGLSFAYLKRSWSIVTPTMVDGADAAWLAEPHQIVYVDRTGVERRETARLSGPSLVWQPLIADRRSTARLEGIAELDAARRIAESLA